MMTGWTNSTATCWACWGHAGDQHHRVAWSSTAGPGPWTPKQVLPATAVPAGLRHPGARPLIQLHEHLPSCLKGDGSAVHLPMFRRERPGRVHGAPQEPEAAVRRSAMVQPARASQRPTSGMVMKRQDEAQGQTGGDTPLAKARATDLVPRLVHPVPRGQLGSVEDVARYVNGHGGDPEDEAGFVYEQHPGVPCCRREEESYPRREDDHGQGNQYWSEQAQRHGRRTLTPIGRSARGSTERSAM